MKIFKRLVGIIISLAIIFTAVSLSRTEVYAAGLSLSVNSAKVNVGGTVTATVSVPSGYGATVAVSYDSSVLTYASCSVTASANAGTVVLNIGDAMGYSNSATITFKASAAGNASISASATTAGNAEGDAVDLSGASKSVKVENKASSKDNTQDDANKNDANKADGDTKSDSNNSDADNSDANANKSSDGTLKSLVISSGKLSPAFASGTTKYTATVSNDITRVSITAIPNDSKASVVSVSGNDKLAVGANTITIKVKAENGVDTTYTIVVTREEASTETKPEVTPVTFTVNNQTLYSISEIPDDVIPDDFEKISISIDGQECAGLNYLNGNLKLLYLGAQDGTNGSLYVYDESQGAVYSFIRLKCEEQYIILLLPDGADVPNGYKETTLSIEGKGVIEAYKSQDSSFELVYAMNSSGETKWYQYDDVEGTYQRYVGKDEKVEQGTEGVTTDGDSDYDNEEIKRLNQKLNHTYIFTGAIIVILLLICLALFIIGRNNAGTKAQDEEKNDELYDFTDSKVDIIDKKTEKVDEKSGKTDKIRGNTEKLQNEITDLNYSDDGTEKSADISEEAQIRKMIADAQSLLKQSMSEIKTDEDGNEDSNK